MVFSSIEFLFLYLPFAFLIYFLIPANFLIWRNVALLVLSLIFYGWSEPLYIFIMLFSIGVDYICGYLVWEHQDTHPKKAKAALVASIVLNLSVLGFFKYFDFFVINLSRIPIFSGLKPLGITLPVGISFYTFQTMSYTLDIYLKKATLQKNIFSFGTYVTMFPQLIAGPIVRYRDIDEALRFRKHSVGNAARGIERFICGLGKKVLLANTAGLMYEQITQTVKVMPSVLSAWTALVFYGFQIYFDFSGYSDMAIGLGLVLGFKFPENFNYPYISKSITEFWRRWHITLSTWFREYVYIPLGGSRRTKTRTYLNIFIVWLLTGFWHGASWNFILWGLYFCLLLIIEKAFLKKLLDKIPGVFAHLYFIFFVLIGWYIFVSCDISEPINYIKAMFSGPIISQTAIYDIVRSAIFLPILILASTPIPKRIHLKLSDKKGFGGVKLVFLIIILLICVAYLVDSSYNPFLYFRF